MVRISVDPWLYARAGGSSTKLLALLDRAVEEVDMKNNVAFSVSVPSYLVAAARKCAEETGASFSSVIASAMANTAWGRGVELGDRIWDALENGWSGKIFGDDKNTEYETVDMPWMKYMGSLDELRSIQVSVSRRAYVLGRVAAWQGMKAAEKAEAERVGNEEV